nr:interferon stimulated exonuclease gene [Hymenolepis microstoma]
MCIKSHDEFYSQLDNWVKQEENRIKVCQSVLNKALENSCQPVSEFRIWKFPRINTASIEISRNFPGRRTYRRIEQTQTRYSRFRLPSIKQRFLAEIVDVIIIFAIKILLIYLVVDAENFNAFLYSLPLEIVDLLPGYRFANRLISLPYAYYDALQQGGGFDFEVFHKEVMIGSRYESGRLSYLISSVLWAVFEIYLVSKPVFDFGPGGCSFGKYLLNLRILSYNHRVNLPGAVDLNPAANPGVFRAMVRAALKNTGISIWSPLLQIIFNDDPVWCYDVMAGTVVVQLPELEPPE